MSRTRSSSSRRREGRVANALGRAEASAGCRLEPHDLAIAKYVARRDEDLAFNRALAQRGIVGAERLLQLLLKTPVTEAVRQRVRSDYGGRLSGRVIIESSRPLSTLVTWHMRS